ncbi:hypothetical protein M0804_015558 [Polistes exclamans]|nr:hypothetical protein M0804_015558 [Polistes exclamans]
MADEEHIWYCMLYKYELERKANEAAKNICSAMDKDTVSVRKCQCFFKKFRGGNFSLFDENGQGRVSNVDQESLEALLIRNPQITQLELATALTPCTILMSLTRDENFRPNMDVTSRARCSVPDQT